MKHLLFLTLIGLLTSGCAHTNTERDPQAIPGETFSAGGKARIPNDPYLNGSPIDGTYICFHKAVLVKPGPNPTSYGPTSSPSSFWPFSKLNSPYCGFYTDSDSNIVIPAGTMIKATDAGSGMLAWGGGRDNSDKFPKMMSLACIHKVDSKEMPYASMSNSQVNSYFAGTMTMTNNDNFKCEAR